MLITEKSNPNTLNLHEMSALEIVQTMNAEDVTISQAVQRALPEIASAVDLIMERLEKGGRLFYVGAGTSGRLGIQDA
jgi:N-acetylmuramic acid 6-phosphate etherase